MKKKIIITLSRVFPTVQSRAGEPTDFKKKLEEGKKIHTIRRNFDQWKFNAEKIASGKYYLSLRQWSGRPYRSPQEEIARIDTPIGVQKIEILYRYENDTIMAKIDGKYFSPYCYDIANNDGLSTEEFKEWFFGKRRNRDMVFHGVIIHFTDFRY